MATLNKSALSKALALLAGLLPARPVKSIFGAVLMSPVDDTHLEVSAGDPSFWARAVIKGKITDFSEPIGVRPRFLRELLTMLPGDTVELKVNPFKTEISAVVGSYQANVRGLHGSDFAPVSRGKEEEQAFGLELDAAQRISKVLPAVLEDNIDLTNLRKNITRAKVDLVAGRLRLIGTDGYRMSVVYLPATGGDLSSVITQDTLTLLMAALKSVEATKITVLAGEQAGFRIEGSGQIELFEYYTSNEIKSYPDVSAFIELHKAYPLRSLVSGADMRRSLRQIKSFGGKMVELAASPSEVVITASDSGIGDTATHLDATFPMADGTDVKVLCGRDFLTDALAVLGGDGVMLAVQNAFRPILLYPPPISGQDLDELHIIMPMQPQDAQGTNK